MQHVIYTYKLCTSDFMTPYQATNSLSGLLNSLLSGWHMKPRFEMSFHHIFYSMFLLYIHFKACVQTSTIRFWMELLVQAALCCVFFCCLLINLLQWPHCYVTTEGGWLAGPEEVIRSEFTDSLTRDIRGASFSHAQWSPGSDSTKAVCLQGNPTGPERPANTCHPQMLQAQ